VKEKSTREKVRSVSVVVLSSYGGGGFQIAPASVHTSHTNLDAAASSSPASLSHTHRDHILFLVHMYLKIDHS
jgi:hypothetical protein